MLARSMVQTHENILVDLGLSKNETKSYIALLELGIAATGQVAEKSKLHRASAYDALERLQAKGLVSFHLRQSIKYYEAMDPKNLLHLLKTKEQQLEEIMPQLQLLRSHSLTFFIHFLNIKSRFLHMAFRRLHRRL